MKQIKFFFILFAGVLLHLVGHGLMKEVNSQEGSNIFVFSSFDTVAWVFFILYYCLILSLAKHLSEQKWD